jgi:hypothetical protein
MKKQYIPLYIGLLASAAPLVAADQKPTDLWDTWSWMPPTESSTIAPQPTEERARSLTEQYPITMALLKAEIQRSSATDIRQRARRALAEHKPKIAYDSVNDMQLEEIPTLLFIKSSFNGNATDLLARNIWAVVSSKETSFNDFGEGSAYDVVKLQEKKHWTNIQAMKFTTIILCDVLPLCTACPT